MGKKDRRPTKIYPDGIYGEVHGAFAMQPITKPDSRFEKTNVARPDDESVIENKEWVDYNEK